MNGGGLSALGLVLAMTACTADDTAVLAPDSGGASEDATAPGIDGSPPAVDSSPPAVDSSPLGVDATLDIDASDGAVAETGVSQDGEAGADAGSDADASAVDGGHDAGEGGSASCLPAGTWVATSVSCNGAPLSLGTLTWTATVAGNAGAFAEKVGTCSITESGPITCAGSVVSTSQSSPQVCTPPGCSPFTSQCGVIPAGGNLYWKYVSNSPTQFTLTSMNEPDGGPTPLRTCTGQGKPNPVAVVWTKQ